MALYISWALVSGTVWDIQSALGFWFKVAMYELDEWSHDAGTVTQGQLDPGRHGSLAIPGVVVGEPGKRDTDADVKSGSNQETTESPS